MEICPVFLSGGSGPRLWPVSRALYPRQFQQFGADLSLLQEMALRVRHPLFGSPLVVCHHEHRFLVASQLNAIECPAADILLEPHSRGTAPAILLAALWVMEHRPTALMLIMPCDHMVSDTEIFHGNVMDACASATAGRIVAFSADAAAPLPEFGYIKPTKSAKSSPDVVRQIEAFIEKPDQQTAEALINDGYCWNSGIYLVKPSSVISEFTRRGEALYGACKRAFDQQCRDLDFTRIADAPFVALESTSFNRLIMEQSENTVVAALNAGWRNTHSWGAVYEAGPKDSNRNVIEGDAIVLNSRNSLIHSDSMLTAVIGLDHIAVIANDDAVLVTDIRQTEGVGDLVDLIASGSTTKHLLHSTRHQPWGSAHIILSGEGFQVNELTVNPGAQISLQHHVHRAEHWVVVEGTANVRRGDEEFLLKENESTYIPSGTLHQLENPGRIPLRIIEIQSGSYLGDDDVIRKSSHNEQHIGLNEQLLGYTNA